MHKFKGLRRRLKMPNEEVQLTAKLKLDTTEAHTQLKQVADQASKATDVKAGKGEVALPKNLTEDIGKMFSGPNGLKSVTMLAKGATGGIGALGGALEGVTQVLGKGGGVVSLVVAIVALLVKLMQGTDTIEKVKLSVAGIVDMLKKTLAPTLALVGEVLLDTIDILKPVLAPVLKLVNSLLVYVSTVLVGLLQVLEPVFELIGALLDVVMEFRTAFSDLLTGILTPIFQMLTYLVESALDPVIDALNRFSDWLVRLKEQLFEFIENITFGLVSVNKKTLATTTGKEKAKIKTSLDKWETSGEETAAERQARLAAKASEDAANAYRDQLDAFNSLTLTFDDIKAKLGAMFEDIRDWIKDTVTNVWDKVTAKATDAWRSIQAAGTEMWTTISDFFKKVFGWLGDGVEAAVDNVADVAGSLWNNASDLASDAWDSTKSIASSVWEGIKSAGNAVGGFFGKIFGHAQGGTLDVGAQIWGMNEQGNPEFMFNAGGRDSVVNASILEDAVAAGMLKANASRKYENKITVSVDKSAPAGQRELAQWLLPSLKFLLGRG